jgi:hypothetical protein
MDDHDILETYLKIRKFDRTRHLVGSGLQRDDLDDYLRYEDLIGAGRRIYWEEKVDGANSGFFFDPMGRLHAQSRGRLLNMAELGGREAQFNLYKQWLKSVEDDLIQVFEDRYIVYGEMPVVAHTTYYDALPHVFLEFDVWDRQEQVFLGTPERHELMRDLPIVSVPVLAVTEDANAGIVQDLVGRKPRDDGPDGRRSLYKSEDWRENLAAAILRESLHLDQTLPHFEDDDRAEGLYGKVEQDGIVVERFKMVRPNFIQTMVVDDSHFQSRQFVFNSLAPGVDVYDPSTIVKHVLPQSTPVGRLPSQSLVASSLPRPW